MINTNLHQQAEEGKLANPSFLKNINIRMLNFTNFHSNIKRCDKVLAQTLIMNTSL